jgi:predicted membrane-bound spermidine synthase
VFKLKAVLTRREFIVGIFQALTAIVSFVTSYLVQAKFIQKHAQKVAYGKNLYGKGTYSGYQTYLPSINKEEV